VVIKAVKVNDEQIVPSSLIPAQPDDLVEAEVYISDWDGDWAGSRLNTYQVTFDAFSFFKPHVPGQGVLWPVGWAAMPLRACADGSDCSLAQPACYPSYGPNHCGCESDNDCPSSFPDCIAEDNICAAEPVHDPVGAIGLDETRNDFAHHSFERVTAIRPIRGTGDPAVGSTVLSGVGPLDDGSELYAGTLTLRISSDACGLFVVGFYPIQETNFVGLAMEDFGMRRFAPFGTRVPLQILVEPGVECASLPAVLSGAEPPVGTRLTRVRKNTIRLHFDHDLSMPASGEVLVHELPIDECAGPDPEDDLSDFLDISLQIDDQGNPRRLRIQDSRGFNVFEPGKWYRVQNQGAWAGVAPFSVDYQLLVGDVDNDGFTLFSDLSVIYEYIPLRNAPDTSPYDINSDGIVNFGDLSATNVFIPSVAIANPCEE
jgi:hypothetical protein